MQEGREASQAPGGRGAGIQEGGRLVRHLGAGAGMQAGSRLFRHLGGRSRKAGSGRLVRYLCAGGGRQEGGRQDVADAQSRVPGGRSERSGDGEGEPRFRILYNHNR
ncbi:MAG: hypothetical protein LBT40_08295 [Deltaproteobacteria bacterium]|jgi:hypothetical protein|nr:hypothetical protein [Deltaproteobacteria bacterium]